MPVMDEPACLYLVHWRGANCERPPGDDVFTLGPGLFLIQSGATRSQVYHAIKRACAPDALLVAPLDAAPKFKGYESGALTWLRERGWA
jgi:hypothetical protein